MKVDESELKNDPNSSQGGPFITNEIMKENLKAAGKAYDDETLANMSVDEAYDAFFGIFNNGPMSRFRSK